MSFTATFANALAGISANTLRAEILSFNIANAQTDNYARRAIDFAPVNPGGVRAIGIERVNAGNLEVGLLAAENKATGADVRSSALSQLNTNFGELGDPDGLYTSALQFKEAIADLRLTPESAAAQTSLLRAGQDLSETFGNLNRQAQDLRLDADREIGQTVDRLNDAFSELVSLNAQARRPRGVAFDNVAERQRALVLEISREIDIDVAGDYGEALTIRTAGGFLLVGERAGTLEFTPTGTMNDSFTLGSGTLSGLSVDGNDITPGTVQGLREGGLAARFAVRDTLVPDFTAKLSNAARDLEQRLQVAGPSVPEGFFVFASGTTSFADRLQVNPLLDPTQGGELFRVRDGVDAAVSGPDGGDGVLGAMEDALDAVLAPGPTTFVSGNFNFIDSLGALSTDLGTQDLRGQGTRDGARGALDTRGTEISRLTEVDTDRELQDLILIEQAFAANARVVSVADEMLRQLLEL